MNSHDLARELAALETAERQQHDERRQLAERHRRASEVRLHALRAAHGFDLNAALAGMNRGHDVILDGLDRGRAAIATAHAGISRVAQTGPVAPPPPTPTAPRGVGPEHAVIPA